MKAQRYIKRDHPDIIIATVVNGICEGAIWWQGPGEKIRVQWMSGDPYEGKTVEELKAAEFRSEAQDSAMMAAIEERENQ